MKNQDDFISLIQQHKGLLNKLLFLYADSSEERKDLRQEILLQAWKSFHRFKGESQFSTWFYRIGINVGITFFSKKKKYQQLHVNNPPTSRLATDLDEKELLEYILRQLNKIDRTVLILFIEGYKQGEIASLLGISAENVRVKIHRIRKKLQKNGIAGYMV